MMKPIEMKDIPVINHNEGIEMWVKNETKSSKWKKLWVIAFTKNGKPITKLQESNIVTMYDKFKYIETQTVPIDLNTIPAWCFGQPMRSPDTIFDNLKCRLFMIKLVNSSVIVIPTYSKTEYEFPLSDLVRQKVYIEHDGKRFNLYQEIEINPNDIVTEEDLFDDEIEASGFVK